MLRGHGYALVHTKALLHALLFLDDHSRFIVGHALTDSPSSAVVTATFRGAMARHGKPEAVRTDRGGAFVAYTKDGDFGRALEAELVDHVVGRSYSPRGGGKVESAIGTLKRELWECFQFEDRSEAERRLAAFVEEILSAPSGAPLEVLRLVLHDGVMEMRFCGARVQLGPLCT